MNSPTAKDDPAVHAWAVLLRTGQKVLRLIEADLKDQGFPPLHWYDVLLELDRAEGRRLRQFELEERMALAQYNLSRLIDRMEAQGLVERKGCPNDRRGNHVVPTAEGVALRRRMAPPYRAAIARHFGNVLAPCAAERLTDALSRFSRWPAEISDCLQDESSPR